MCAILFFFPTALLSRWCRIHLNGRRESPPGGADFGRQSNAQVSAVQETSGRTSSQVSHGAVLVETNWLQTRFPHRLCAVYQIGNAVSSSNVDHDHVEFQRNNYEESPATNSVTVNFRWWLVTLSWDLLPYPTARFCPGVARCRRQGT